MRTTQDPRAEVVEALKRAGLPVAVRAGDLIIDGVRVELDVSERAVVTPAVARGLHRPRVGALGVVVADRISQDARHELAAVGWSWVDRRGHVRLWAPGLRVMSEITPLAAPRADARFASVFPPVGVEIALALLKDPDPDVDWTPTELARVVGRSVGGVSERLRALRDAGLVDRRNRPLQPELFWELVTPWRERSFGLAAFPALGSGFAQLSWLGLPAGWTLTDTRAALALGAPLIASADGPPDFYVPQASMVDLALAHFGAARGEPAATVRAIRFAGVHEVEPFRVTPDGFRVAHPVVVALDLAQDRARGREVVGQWDPISVGVTRVW